jgi:hypothetical protein
MLFAAYIPYQQGERGLQETAKKWSTDELIVVLIVITVFLMWFLKRRKK